MLHRRVNATGLSPVSFRGKRSLVLASIVLSLGAIPTVTKRMLAQDQENGGSISGHVTIQGKHGANLTVGLFEDNAFVFSNEGVIKKTETDAEGHFQFSGIKSNHYWVKVLSPNYVAAGEWYVRQGRLATLVRGESVDKIDFDVIAGGIVSGRIIDVDGNPVVDEMIYLFRVVGSAPSYEAPWYDHDNFKTDEAGAYRVFGVPPGQYRIGIGEDIPRLTGAVHYKNDFGAVDGRVSRDHYYEQTLYPGVEKREQGQIFEVSSGSELSGIDFAVSKMRRAYRVSGRVIDAETGKPVSSCHIQVGHLFAGGSSSGYTSNGPSDVDDSGNFSVTGFLFGHFFVNAMFSHDSVLYGERVDFELKDRDVDGIVIKARRGFIVRGKVAIEGTPSAEALAKRGELKLQASTSEPNQKPASASKELAVNPDGTFEIVGLPRGPVDISAVYCQVCGFFAMERIEYTTVHAKDQIQLAEMRSDRDIRTLNVDRDMQGVRIVLRYKAASILCHVSVVGELQPGVRLMVSIDSGIGRGGWSGWRDVDANGDMLQTGLEPGEYSLEVGDGSQRFTTPKRITITNNQQAKVSFTIDASKIQERD